MASVRPPRGFRRETGLLLVTIAVSVVMLFLLARLRFPDRAATEPQAPPTQPLERLAASATYDELAGILRGVDRQVAGAIVTVPTAPDVRGSANEPSSTYVPAVRIADGRAVALPGPGRHVSIPATATAKPAIKVLAADNPRGLALLLIAPQESDTIPKLAVLDSLPAAPGYFAAIEATRSGPAVRPLYFGRLDRIYDARWQAPILRFTALQQLLPAGAAIFTLDARFIGVGFPEDRDFLVVPAVALLAEAERLSLQGSVASADLGVDVQALDPGLRAATGADAGVVVAYVNPNGPAAQHLAAADVVTAIGSAPVRSKTDYAAALMQLAPGTAVTVALVRHGAPMTVSMTPVARGSIPEQGGGDLGLDLRDVKGAGAEAVRVAPRSAAALAGIEPGDLIVGIGDADVPDARTIARVFQQAAAGSHILVRIERGPEHLVLALAKP